MIAIRTVGIYEEDWGKYEGIRRGMLDSYRNLTTDPQVIKNTLYLMNYG